MTATGIPVSRESVVETLIDWIGRTRSSKLGEPFSVSQPAGARRYAEYLIDGAGEAGGPVRAVLEAAGILIDDGSDG